MYIHKVQYYETDKMGITHHSNYIRWMEEARIAYLETLGYPFERLEAEGVFSPVVAVNCSYKRPTTFGDSVSIDVKIQEYKGVKLIISYRMSSADGSTVCEASSTHCFTNKDGKLIKLAKEAPDFHGTLLSVM